MPGHTDGSMAIIVNDNIFSGDTIMFEKHGKTSLPGGNEKLLISSIEKMMNTSFNAKIWSVWPCVIKMYLRHNPSSSIVLIISAALSAGSIRIAFFLFEETIY